MFSTHLGNFHPVLIEGLPCLWIQEPLFWRRLPLSVRAGPYINSKHTKPRSMVLIVQLVTINLVVPTGLPPDSIP